MSSFPIAPGRPHEITQHGQTRIDNYYWMRDKNDPETMKHLRAESDYLEEVMQHTKPLQESLFSEMKARIKEDDSTVPEKRGGYFYYERGEQGKQYPIFCRRKDSLEAAEEILLDQNQLAEGKSFCSVGAFSISPDGMKLIYSVDYGGREIYTLYIKDLGSGRLYPEVIENTFGSAYERGGAEWANDNETIFYVTLDDAQRSDKLFRHKLGTDPAQDTLVFHEKDETYFLYVFKTRDDAYIMTFHYSTNTREMNFLSADHPEERMRVLQPRIKGLEYFAAHHNGKFFIVHNENAENFKLSVAPVESPQKKNWREVIPHRADVLVDGVDTFEDFIVVTERKGGLKQLRISDADGLGNVRYIQFPEPAYNVHLHSNPEFKTNLLRLHYSSLITPNSTVDYHVDGGEWELKKEDEIPSGYDKTQYASERIHATASDGTLVPMSIVYKKGLKRDGNNPALMYGYGSYGATIDAAFSSTRLSLLDRGFVFAIGHIRGGSDMGREWYEGGRMMNKKNTFTDFIACAEHLIKEGFTSPQKLAIMGGSAGGLLVGACVTMRPDLFKAVICKVPFVDVVTTMNDPTIPLTTLEYDQWGNPEEKEYYDYMLSYSPYDNIRATEYPHMLITTGLNDPRVAYWEPAKFAAKLRELKTNDNLIVLYTNYDSGHAGASGRYDFLKEVAQDYAFLIDKLVIES
ncbi:MAG: S9 family peptidase [Chloroflexi bacterium]|nr:S9 family peptidase [Chloroflexota bacterium]